MVLGGELATNEALKQFKSLGTDLLAVSINAVSQHNQADSGKSEHLSLDDAVSLSQAEAGILELAPYTQVFESIAYEGKAINAVTLGVTKSFADIMQIKMQRGRFVSLADRYAFFCVIGQDIYKEMRLISQKEPIGQQLQVGKNMFVVVGIAEPWTESSFLYTNIDNAVLIPVMASTLISKYASIQNIVMRLSPQANIPKIESALTARIQELLGDKQIFFRSAKELIEKMRKQSDIMTIFLGLIGSISLIVGGIGVMNIMLVSVMERRREIGIRLAVGATRRDIALLFLMEAVMLSLLGGVIGVIIGVLTAWLIAWFSQWEFTLFLLPPFVGFSVSVIVGIFSGFYPAYLASKMNPIDALRSE